MALFRSSPLVRGLPFRTLRSTLVAVLTLFLVTCTDNPTGPRPGLGGLRVRPAFDQFARLAPLTLNRVRVLVVRDADTIVRESRSFSVNTTELQLSLQVPLVRPVEQLQVILELYADQTLLFSGSSIVEVSQGQVTSIQSIDVSYVGPGGNVAVLGLLPQDTSVFFGATVPFTANAFDGQGVPVSQFYVSWSLVGTPAAGATIDAAGSFLAPNARDTVLVSGATPSGAVDTARVFVIPPPASVTKVGGDDQSALPSQRLPQPLQLRVNDGNGQPIEGIRVAFAPGVGGGSVDSAVATTDAGGIARSGATLGSAIGGQTFTATVPGLAPATFNATATGLTVASVPLAAGGDHTCEIRTGGALFCWGANPSGSLGDGTFGDRLVATPVSGGVVAAAVAVGPAHACALTAGGQAFCWGENEVGQLGDGGNTPRPTPGAVTGGRTFVRLVAGTDFTCGLTSTGQAFCWGLNDSGQLGDGTPTSRNTPTAVSGAISFTRLTAGGEHACGLDGQGQAFCWGNNSNGQLGDGGQTPRNVPTAVTGGLSFSTISVGDVTSCALNTAGAGFCWGFNFGAILTTPTAVGGGTFVSADMGGNHVCALTAAGQAFCGGDNGGGQLGDGTTTDRPTPTAVSGGFTYTDIAGGALHTCGRTSSGTRCWGTNLTGQLGDGSTSDRLTPTPVRGPAASVSAAAGDGQIAAPGSTLPIAPMVVVRDAGGTALPGVEVVFTVGTGGGSVTGGVALTNAAGEASPTSWTLGLAEGTNTVLATVSSSGVAGNPVTFTATASGTVATTRIWNGAVSTDWSTAGNWVPSGVPSTLDSAVIGTAVNQPLLSEPSIVGAVSIVAGGNLTINGQSLVVIRGFSTGGTGVLTMSDPADGVSVLGNALFNGGNELGLLSAGTFVVAGNLTQQAGTSGDSYHPSGSHVTGLTGVNPTVTFATPGDVPGSSHFQELIWVGTGTLTLGSNVFAHGEFIIGGTAALSINSSNGSRLTLGDLLSVAPVTFDNVPLTIKTVNTTDLTLRDITFSNMPTTVAQLVVSHPGLSGSSLTFTNLAFGTVPVGPNGFYLVANDTTGVTDAGLVIDMVNPTPATPGAFVQQSNGAVVNWPAFGTTTWTGSLDANWQAPGNWSTNAVPGPTDNVLIPAATPNSPIFDNGAAIRDLTVQVGATLSNTSDGALVVGGSLDVLGSITGPGELQMSGAGSARGTISNLRVVNGTIILNGSLTVSSGISLLGTGSLTLAGNRVTVGGNFSTSDQATLVMVTPLDSLVVTGETSFGGGDETGRLVEGGILANGSFFQFAGSNPTSFVASGNHTVRLTNAAVSQEINFTTPLQSRFNNLDVSEALGGVTLSSDVFASGQLVSQPSDNPPTISSAAHGLTVTGLDVDGLVLQNTLLSSVGGTLTSFSNASFNGFGPALVQFTLVHPGLAAPFVLDGISFNSVPVLPGLYLRVSDNDAANGLVLQVEVTNSNPVSGAPFFEALGGASVAWPPAAPVIVWLGTISSDWSLPSNWSLGAVPTPLDSVFVGVAPNAPALSINVTAGAVVVDAGVLNLNNFTLGLARGFATTGGGRVNMTQPNSQLNALDVVFGGGDQTGLLTDGRIVLGGTPAGGGTFRQLNNGGVLTTFTATGNHLVQLLGNSNTVNFDAPGASFLQHLEASSGPGGTIIGFAFVNGTLTVNSSNFNASTLHVLGALTVAPASGMGIDSLFLGDVITPGSGFVSSNVYVFDKAAGVQTLPKAGPNVPFTTVLIRSDALVDSAITADALTIQGTGRLSLAGGKGTISGDFATAGSGALIMTDVTDTLIINGNAVFAGGDETGSLTAGTLRVRGNFTQLGTANAYVSNGSHKTVFDGAASQSIVINDGGAATTRFQDVEVGNTSNPVTLPTTGQVMVVNGVLSLPVPATFTGGANVLAQGPVTTVTGSTLSVFSLEASGSALSVAGNYGVAQTQLHGTVVPSISYNDLTLLDGGTLASNVTAAGSVSTLGRLDLNGRTLTVGIDFSTSTAAGVLVMNNPLDLLIVARLTIFGGGNESGLLTEGLMRISGHFRQDGTNSTSSFAPVGNHTVELATPNAVDNTVFFANPQVSSFNHLRVLTLTDFLTDVLVFRDMLVNFNAPANLLARRLVVQGRLTKAGIGFFGGRLLVLEGGLTVTGGNFGPDTTEFRTLTQTMPINGGTNYRTVLVTSDVTAEAAAGSLSGDLVISGNGIFRLGGAILTLGGGLQTTGQGALEMNVATSSLTVTGDASFAGSNTFGLLTNGTLDLRQNFSQSAITSVTSFAPSGNHKTVLQSPTAVTMDFGSPGAGGGGSHFQVLDLSGAVGGVALTVNSIVDSLISTSPAAKLIGGGSSLTMRRAQITGLVSDNTPLILDEQGTFAPENLSNITFQGFSGPGAVLMTISGPGGTVAARPTVSTSNMNFPTLPTGAGNLYVKLTSTNIGFFTLTMTGSNQGILAGGNGLLLSDPPNQQTILGALINWP